MAHDPAEAYPLLIDRYAVFDELGRGGMARVHLARLYGSVSFSRLVAFKRMLPEAIDDDDYVAMLIDEARLGARIRHPNVVPVLDVVRAGSELGLVMDYIHGPSLAWLVRHLASRDERVPESVALRIAVDVLYGLHAAHEATNERGASLEIVHRDVSPHNILVGADGLARIADFGIAKAVGRLARSSAGEIRGKLRYMAPEHLRGETIDRRADLFALGIVLWEMLTARSLFAPGGEDYAQISARVLSTPIPKPSEHVAVPAALEAIVMKLLERDRSQRFTTAEAAATALERSGLAIATPAEVARWLAGAASGMLEERTALIQDVEQTSRAFSAPADTAPATVPATERAIAHTVPVPLALAPTEPMAAVPARPVAATVVSARIQADAGTAILAPPPAKSRWPLVVAAIALLVVIGVIASVVMSRGNGGRRGGGGGRAPDASAHRRHAQ